MLTPSGGLAPPPQTDPGSATAVAPQKGISKIKRKKINLCMTSKLPIIKNKLPCHNEISDNLLLYIVNKHQCNLFTICSFINSLFTGNW